MNPASASDRQSVILLGASNLTLGWKPMLKALQATVPGPLDIRVALGMGRSYVDSSRVLFRRLPGIVKCGLWDNLPKAGEKPPLVLLTDLGNDIAYMHSPETILGTVDLCVRRILDWRSDARIVMTGLPLASLKTVGAFRYRIARQLCFPGSPLSLSEALAKSEALDHSARHIAQQLSIPCVTPRGEWYRADPIHVIRPLREHVFRLFFSHWNLQPPDTGLQHVLPRAGLPTTAQQTVCGFPRHVRQPVFEAPELVVSAW